MLGPIPPGHVKQLSYGYVLPAGGAGIALPIDQATLELNLLVEDTTAAVNAPGVESLGVQEIEQRRFAAYRAGPLAAGDRVTIGLPRGAFRPHRSGTRNFFEFEASQRLDSGFKRQRLERRHGSQCTAG